MNALTPNVDVRIGIFCIFIIEPRASDDQWGFVVKEVDIVVTSKVAIHDGDLSTLDAHNSALSSLVAVIHRIIFKCCLLNVDL